MFCVYVYYFCKRLLSNNLIQLNIYFNQNFQLIKWKFTPIRIKKTNKKIHGSKNKTIALKFGFKFTTAHSNILYFFSVLAKNFKLVGTRFNLYLNNEAK